MSLGTGKGAGEVAFALSLFHGYPEAAALTQLFQRRASYADVSYLLKGDADPTRVFVLGQEEPLFRKDNDPPGIAVEDKAGEEKNYCQKVAGDSDKRRQPGLQQKGGERSRPGKDELY